MLVALCSDKGSPGVTTTTLALAAAWPGEAIVVEADMYGGDLAMRARTAGGGVLAETPTVLSMASAARTSGDAHFVARYAQRLRDGVLAVPGFAMAEQGAGVGDWTHAGQAMAHSTHPVFADLGRIHSASPTLPVAAAADTLVVVSRSDLGSVVRLRERLIRLVPAITALSDSPPRIVVVIVTSRRYAVGDVEDVQRFLEDCAVAPFLAAVAHLPLDPGGVAHLLHGRAASGRRRRRTPLSKAAQRLTWLLTDGDTDDLDVDVDYTVEHDDGSDGAHGEASTAPESAHEGGRSLNWPGRSSDEAGAGAMPGPARTRTESAVRPAAKESAPPARAGSRTESGCVDLWGREP